MTATQAEIRAVPSMKQTDPADPLLFKDTTAFRRQVLEPRSLKDTPGQAGRGMPSHIRGGDKIASDTQITSEEGESTPLVDVVAPE